MHENGAIYDLERTITLLLQEFENPCLKDQLDLALRLDHTAVDAYLAGEQAAHSWATAPLGADSDADADADDFYSLLLQGSTDVEMRHHLLHLAWRKHNIELSVLSAVLDRQQTFSGLCLYIYLNLK